MLALSRSDRPLLLGFALGLAFGIVDVLFTWIDPLSDDSIPALLRFYGPMFFMWAFASFRAARSFVNSEYLKGAPFKIGMASVIGAAMGLVGGAFGRLGARSLAGAAHGYVSR